MIIVEILKKYTLILRGCKDTTIAFKLNLQKLVQLGFSNKGNFGNFREVKKTYI